MQRSEVLERLQHLLNTPDGEMLMEELRLTWDAIGFYNKEPHQVQYMAGQRDAFKFLEMLRDGSLIEETPNE